VRVAARAGADDDDLAAEPLRHALVDLVVREDRRSYLGNLEPAQVDSVRRVP